MENPEAKGARRPHRVVGQNRLIRTASFAACFVVIGAHGVDRGFGALFWALLALQFLVYPQVVYYVARAARKSKDAEMRNLFADSTLLGAWMGALTFPTWITFSLLFATSLNMTVLRGVQGALMSVGCFSIGAAIAVAMHGFRYGPETSDLVTFLCFAGSLVYACGIGYVMYGLNRRVLAARDAVHQSETRYRLIAEHAADLIALLDHDGRWLYASPSYRRLLEAQDLEVGADAFRRVHPDDADSARIAVLRSAATGKARELPMRLVDKEGRIRQLKTRVQAINGNPDAPKRLVLVSQDVTDLRESEERLLLAAHALEGMTEAIMITAADGTVVTVNRAFSEITGYSRDDVLGRSEKETRNALQPPDFYDELYGVVRRDGYWSGTTWSRRRNGAVYREWRSVRAVRDAAGGVTHYVIVFYEVGVPRAGDASQQDQRA
jgi:PAS domain S-box-containing protein